MNTENISKSPESGDERTGKGVQDFQYRGVKNAVLESLSLLAVGRRRKLIIITGIQISLALLDLVGITLLGLLAAVAVSGIGATGIPSLIQSGIDLFGLAGLTVSQLSILLASLAVTVLVGKTAISAYVSRRIYRFLANQQSEVSAKLTREFLSRPLMEVQKWTTSEATYALGAGVGAATVAILGAAIIIISEIFLFAVVILTLGSVDLPTTLAAIAIFGTAGLVMHRSLSSRGARNSITITEGSVDTLSAVSEALHTYRETLVLSRRELYIARYQAIIGRMARAEASNAYLLEVPKYVLEAALYLAVLLLAVTQFLTKDLGAAAATVALFLAAGSRVVPALLRLQGATITIRNSSVRAQPTFYLRDVLEATTADKAVIDRSMSPLSALQLRERIAAGHGDFSARVEVRNASLTYFNANAPALSGASLIIEPGCSAALVGTTGAGKTSLADIIIGVLEPSKGSVRLSGLTPRDAIARWPGALAYVPQIVALVYGSVRANVALGLPRDAVDDNLVWEALERAHLAEYLRENRTGIDTSIGERGVRLSGGQRQRLGIARALYTRPRLLVLDEATSSLDSETEQAIVSTLKDLEGKVTTITVAHRLATVRNADQVIYLENGLIMAKGSFDQVRSQVPNFDRQASLLGL